MSEEDFIPIVNYGVDSISVGYPKDSEKLMEKHFKVIGGDVWKTEKQAEFIYKRQQLERHMWQFAWDKNGSEWMNEMNYSNHYGIQILGFDYFYFYIEKFPGACVFQIPFRTKEIGEEALKVFKDGLEKYYFWKGEE